MNTRDQSNVEGVEDTTDLKALNAMYVGDIRDGVYSIYTNVYRHTVYCIHAPHPSKKEGSI